MKKILLLASVLISVYVSGQTYSYIPMADSAAKWVGEGSFTDNGTQFTVYPDTEYIHNDTMVNGKAYHIIITKSHGGGIPYLMREDSFRKVFAIGYFANSNGIGVIDTSEQLLYDFSLQVGQGFYDSVLSFKAVVQSIDTILTPGGLRRQFTVVDSFFVDTSGINVQMDYWIEGVGSKKILANSYGYCFEACRCLSYLLLGGQIVYQDTFTCPLIVNGITNIALPNIDIYPNPASRVLTIDMRQNTDAISTNYIAINIYNVLGQKIATIPRHDNTKLLEISLSNMPDGICVSTILDAHNTEIVLGKFTVLR